MLFVKKGVSFVEFEYQTCWIAGVKSEERNDLRDEEKCLETKLGQIVFVEEPGTIFFLMMNIWAEGGEYPVTIHLQLTIRANH